MKILGVNKTGKYIEYAVVEDGVKLLSNGLSEIGSNLSHQIASLAKQADIKTVAVTHNLNQELANFPKDLTLISVDPQVAAAQESWLGLDSFDDPFELKTQFPYILWQDTDKGTTLSLVDSPTKIRVINDVAQGATRLLKTLSKTMEHDFLELAEQGNENFFVFEPVLQTEEFDLIRLNEQLKLALDSYVPPEISVSQAVASELKEFYRFDLAASLHDTLINSILFKLVTLGDELSVNSFAISGDLAFNSRLRKLANDQAQINNFTIHFNENEQPNLAAGIAGLAYFLAK